MKLIPSQFNNKAVTAVKVEHGSQNIEWSIGLYDRATLKRKENLFDNANLYLSTLDKDTHARIWNVYKDIFDSLETVDNTEVLQRMVTESVSDLYAILDVDNLRYWSSMHGQYTYPPNLADDYGPKHTKELTYLRKDYTGLLFLSTALRFMVPIWGEFIKRYKGITGTVYKEYLGAMILGQSELFTSPEVERLHEYIVATIGSGKITPTAIHGGLGSADQPDWLLSLTLIRRLAIAESFDAEPSIISSIYNFLTSNIENMDKKFGQGNKVLDKHPPNGGGDIEDNSSVAENYRVNQMVSDAPAIINSVYVEDVKRLAWLIEPDLPESLLNACVNKLIKDSSLEIEPFRINLVGVIVREHISIRSLHSLDYVTLLRLIGLTQAILYFHEYVDLAQLITARGKDPDLSVIRSNMMGSESRSRLSKEHTEALNLLYPYYRQIGRSTERNKNDNVGIQFIESFNRDTLTREWYYQSPVQILERGVGNGKPFFIPTNLKNILAGLILDKLGSKEPEETVQTV